MQPQAVLPPELGTDAEYGARVISKVTWRLIPFLCLLFVVNYIDRTNIGMAKLRFMGDVGISEGAYGLGAGLFFIGYFFFEVPSNLILERVGARRWIARIMVSWGVVSAAMMFVTGPASLYVLRFLLGVTEAGFFPGIILFLTYWVPARYRARLMAGFFTSTAISGIVGNPLAGLLMKLDGLGGLHGWQWLFLIEGIIPIVLGVVVWRLLPDGPRNAPWLTDQDKQWIARELAAEGAGRGSRPHVADLRAALVTARLWHLAAIYFMAVMGLYGLGFFGPTLIKAASAGRVSDLAVGFLAAVPPLAGVAGMIAVARSSDRRHERRWHIAGTFIVAAGGMAAVTRASGVPAVVGSLALGAAAYAIFGPFWAMATRFMRGSAAAGGIAAVNSVGNLAGFLAPFAIGYGKQHYGSFSPGLLLVAGALACGAVLVLLVPKAVDERPA